jgi:hypothetical protein
MNVTVLLLNIIANITREKEENAYSARLISLWNNEIS